MLHDQQDEGLEVPSNEEELFGIAAQIGIWQSANALSDAKLLKKFPGLGSTKTYKKLLGRDDEQLNVGTWLPAYKGVLRIIEEETQERTSRVLPDLSHMLSVSTPAMQLTMRTGNKRLMLIQGDTGAGKSTALHHVAAQLPGSVVIVEADESWDSKTAAAAALCLKLGVKIKGNTVRSEDDLPRNFARLQSLLITTLQSRRIIGIDEGHHMSGEVLNLIKTLINRTPCEVVLAAMDSLMKRLEWGSYEEVRQLTQNHLAERVRYGLPASADVGAMVTRRTGFTPDKSQVDTLGAKAAKNGHLKFVTLVCRKATKLAGKDQVTADILNTAMDQVERTR